MINSGTSLYPTVTVSAKLLLNLCCQLFYFYFYSSTCSCAHDLPLSLSLPLSLECHRWAPPAHTHQREGKQIVAEIEVWV